VFGGTPNTAVETTALPMNFDRKESLLSPTLSSTHVRRRG
jgi:hypothetical protein